MNSQPVKLLDRVRHKIRLKHYSIRTEKAYVSWIRRYIYFHNKRHPKEMGRAEIETFLTDLAVNGNISASTQNQAFNALLFLYKQVVNIQVFDQVDALRAKKPQGAVSMGSPISFPLPGLCDQHFWHRIMFSVQTENPASSLHCRSSENCVVDIYSVARMPFAV
jgi:hypothetical protein